MIAQKTVETHCRKVHRVNDATRIVMLGSVGLFLFMASGFLALLIATGKAWEPGGGRELFHAVIPYATLGATMLCLTLPMRIVTSPDGIEYYGFGHHIAAPWSNIKGVELMGPRRYPVLAFHEPGTCTGFLAPLIRRTGGDRYISVSSFEDWPFGELGKEFKHLRPDLSTKPKPSRVSAQKFETKRRDSE
jgi:hypothetical protein